MPQAEKLITEHLDLWASAIKKKPAAGRGSSKKFDLYGVNKLRELILDLAVRGLLVPQDPSDEPANELLKQMEVEKKRLIREGVIKKQKAVPAIKPSEKFFDIPERWQWLRLSSIGHDWGQKKPGNQFTYIDVGSINNALGRIESASVLKANEAPSRARKLVKSGTIIYSTVRPYLLNVAIVDKEFNPEPIASTAFAVIHPYNGILSEYIYTYLRSPAFISYVERKQTGSTYPAINDKNFFNGVIPVPPLDEQRRIVSKVVQLMALCNELEANAEQTIEAHQLLVETLLKALEQAADPENFAMAWERIAQNFDDLFTTEESIDKLRQTILQLAVLGKLVPHDPSDEPASELLNKIEVEKEQLIKRGKEKKQKPPLNLKEFKNPFDVPAGWEWTCLDDLAQINGGFAFKSGNYSEQGDRVVRISDFNESGFINDNIVRHPFSDSLQQFLVKPFDTLMAMTGGTVGKSFYVDILEERMLVNQRVACIRPSEKINSKYIYIVLRSNHIQQEINDSKNSTNDNISMGQIKNFLVPLPSRNQQDLIVQKVDELMAICDQLAKGIKHNSDTRIKLANALAVV